MNCRKTYVFRSCCKKSVQTHKVGVTKKLTLTGGAQAVRCGETQMIPKAAEFCVCVVLPDMK